MRLGISRVRLSLHRGLSLNIKFYKRSCRGIGVLFWGLDSDNFHCRASLPWLLVLCNKSSGWLWNPTQGSLVPTRWHRLVNYLSFDHYINAVLSTLWSNFCLLLTDWYDMVLVSRILIILSLLHLMWEFLIPLWQLSASNSHWFSGNSCG